MKRRRHEDFCLDDFLLFHVLQFCDLSVLFNSVRRVSKQFFRICNHKSLWHDLYLRGFPNCDKLMHFYKSSIYHLTLSKTRWTRRNTFSFLKLENIRTLDLRKCFRNSLIDDRFCYLIRHTSTLRNLFLPPTKISCCGMMELSKLQLSMFTMSENYFVYEDAIRFFLDKQKESLHSINFQSVKGFDNTCLMSCNELQLKNIQISFCSVDTEGIEQFSLMHFPVLQMCVFHGVFINKKTIQNFSQTCPNIDTFTLNSYENSMTEYSELSLMQKLKTLCIICCQPIFDIDFLRASVVKFLYLCRTPLVINSDKQLNEYLQVFVDKGCKLKTCDDAKIFF